MKHKQSSVSPMKRNIRVLGGIVGIIVTLYAGGLYLQKEIDRLTLRSDPHPLTVMVDNKYSHRSRHSSSYYLIFMDRSQSHKLEVTEGYYDQKNIGDRIDLITNNDHTIFCPAGDTDIHYENIAFFIVCVALSILFIRTTAAEYKESL